MEGKSGSGEVKEHQRETKHWKLGRAFEVDAGQVGMEGKCLLSRSTGAQVSRKKGLKADKDRKWEGKAHHMRREPKKLIKK